MSICFSGAYTDSNLARKVYEFFESKYPFIANYVVELYHCDLSDDNVKGLARKEWWWILVTYWSNFRWRWIYKTIFHELVHCIQDINGLSDNNARECEAYKLEQLYYDNFMQTDASKLSL